MSCWTPLATPEGAWARRAPAPAGHDGRRRIVALVKPRLEDDGTWIALRFRPDAYGSIDGCGVHDSRERAMDACGAC